MWKVLDKRKGFFGVWKFEEYGEIHPIQKKLSEAGDEFKLLFTIRLEWKVFDKVF